MPQPASVYTMLRTRVLSTNPHDVGIEQSDSVPNVWGVLMESQIKGTVVTLLSLADGTTSFYFGNGGGILGGGQHEEVAKAAKYFVALTESLYELMAKTAGYPLPGAGRVRFYVLTFAGIYTIDIAEEVLTNKISSFWPLYYAAQNVIAQLRAHTPPVK